MSNCVMTESELARSLKVHIWHLKWWRWTRRSPQWSRLDGVVTYRQNDVERWVNDRANLPRDWRP